MSKNDEPPGERLARGSSVGTQLSRVDDCLCQRARRHSPPQRYRDPEPQAFIWFRDLQERCVWRNEFETLDQAKEAIAASIDH